MPCEKETHYLKKLFIFLVKLTPKIFLHLRINIVIGLTYLYIKCLIMVFKNY